MISSDDQLRGVLLGNAAFSLGSGAALAIGAPALAAGMAPGLPWPALAALGVGVVGFGLVCILLARAESLPRRLVWAVFWADVAWVAGSAGVLVLLRGALTDVGVAIVEMLALVVAALAVLELRGLLSGRAAALRAAG